MIPKVIHYCWFGGNPLPELAVKCINSWKRYFPDFEIKEWNESNFDLDCCDYVREAYQAKRWAFVSDYARFWILYNHGGLYFDTDVEVIRSFDDILDQGPFMGCESVGQCAPGLGLGTPAGLAIYKEILDFYEGRHFLKADGELDVTTVVEYTSDILMRHGWILKNEIQNVEGIHIYPSSYFCPMDYDTGKINLAENTHSIHHYTASWCGNYGRRITELHRICLNCFGQEIGYKIARVLDFPLRIMNSIEQRGFGGSVKFALRKLRNG